MVIIQRRKQVRSCAGGMSGNEDARSGQRKRCLDENEEDAGLSEPSLLRPVRLESVPGNSRIAGPIAESSSKAGLNAQQATESAVLPVGEACGAVVRLMDMPWKMRRVGADDAGHQRQNRPSMLAELNAQLTSATTKRHDRCSGNDTEPEIPATSLRRSATSSVASAVAQLDSFCSTASLLRDNGRMAKPTARRITGSLQRFSHASKSVTFPFVSSLSSISMQHHSDSIQSFAISTPSSSSFWDALPVSDRMSRPNVDSSVAALATSLYAPIDAESFLTDEEIVYDPTIQIEDNQVHEMIENLSVSGHQPSPVSLRLSEDFLNGLSDQEVDALKARGLCYIDLQELEEPLILGRDTFRSVFGEKIRGAETVMLSRRHCVFRISLATSSGETKRAEIKVEIENTSTNGVEVNDRILAHGERHVLSRGDVITLLRIPHNRDGHLQYGFGLPPNDFPESSQATIPDHDFANIETDRLSSQQNNCGKASCVDSGHSMGGDETQPVRIRVSVMIASPVTMEKSRWTMRQHSSFKSDFEALLSPWTATGRLAAHYECATRESLTDAVLSGAQIIVYIGDGTSQQLVAEDTNGSAVLLECSDLREIFAGGCQRKDIMLSARLVIVMAQDLSAAQVLIDCGVQNVLFVNWEERHRPRSLCFLRAMLASILNGQPIWKSFRLANAIALHSLLPCERSDALFKLFSSVNSTDCSLVPQTSRYPFQLLDGQYLPMTTDPFIGREGLVKEIIAVLRYQSPDHVVRVCSMFGHEGVGKSAVAIWVATHANERRWYKGGVHFVHVNHIVKMVGEEEYQQCVTSTKDKQELSRKALGKLENFIDGMIVHARAAEACDGGNSIPTLLVLDGCDVFLAEVFRDFVHNLLERVKSMQVIITSRAEMKMSGGSDAFAEKLFHVKPLTDEQAAHLLKAVVPHLERNGLRKSLAFSDSDDIISLLTKHPVLQNCHGKPGIILRLAHELKVTNQSLDKLE